MNPGEARLAAAVRIATGVLFAAEGAGKLAGDFVHGGFASSAEEMARASWPFWRSFLQSVVVPHAGIFGWVFALAELAVGIGLLLGFATRAAAAGGAALMVAILLGQSYVPGAKWDRWITAGLTTKFALLLLLLILASNAGRVWGIDGRLKRTPSLRRR
jgi:thiosulfate dehydrogenase [quinone] large subunit